MPLVCHICNGMYVIGDNHSCTKEAAMKGVADRTLELMNEYQQSIPRKSYRTFQHFLVVKIEGLEADKEHITDQLHRVARERDGERAKVEQT